METKTSLRVNEKIRFSPVRVMGSDGVALGVISTRQALFLAQEKGLDLVEVAPHARPPVCKIMDYGKFRYEQSIKEKEARKKKISKIKQVRFRPSTDDGDVEIKVRSIQKFLEAGDRVQIFVKFTHREMEHKDLGLSLVNGIIEKVSQFGKPQSPPKAEGKRIICILDPRTKK